MKKKKEKLFEINWKDLQVSYFSGTGAGGQHRNRHKNCVRLFHPESGVIVTGQSYREKRRNEIEALRNLVNHPKFKMWLNLKAWEVINQKSIEELVEEELKPEKLKIEVYRNGKWEEENARHNDVSE